MIMSSNWHILYSISLCYTLTRDIMQFCEIFPIAAHTSVFYNNEYESNAIRWQFIRKLKYLRMVLGEELKQ